MGFVKKLHRYFSVFVNNDSANSIPVDITTTPEPVKFGKDAVTTDVEIDTVTPSNNEPLPTALFNSLGLQGSAMNPFGVAIYDNQTGSRAIVDQNGAIKFGEAIILSGDVLNGQSLSDLLWKSYSINGGSTVGGNGEQIFDTGTLADGGVILQTTKESRFMISQFNISHFGIQLNSSLFTDPNVVVDWGVASLLDDAGNPNASSNGLLIRMKGNDLGDPIWSFVNIKNGVETETFEASWNGASKDKFNPTPTLSVYEMQYNAGTCIFFQGANFLHRLAGLTETYSATYHLPVVFRIRNINGNTTQHTFASRAGGTYRLGEERGELFPIAFTTTASNFTRLLKTGAGYVGACSLSRTGSSGGSGSLSVYDGIDNTGRLIARVDVGGDDIKGHALSGTFSKGLYIEMSGSGTKTANMTFE